MTLLTWRGRREAVWYLLRRLFIRPAPDRCFMGAPVFPAARCPRPVVDGGLWCERHQREMAG